MVFVLQVSVVHLKHIIFAKYFATDIHIRQLVPLPANLSHFYVASATTGSGVGAEVLLRM